VALGVTLKLSYRTECDACIRLGNRLPTLKLLLTCGYCSFLMSFEGLNILMFLNKPMFWSIETLAE
jgi:hypothetical protein